MSPPTYRRAGRHLDPQREKPPAKWEASALRREEQSLQNIVAGVRHGICPSTNGCIQFSLRFFIDGMLGIPASPPRLVTSLARGHQPRANAETSTVMFAKPAKSTEAYLTCLSLIHWAFFLSAVASQTRCTAEIVAFSPIL